MKVFDFSNFTRGKLLDEVALIGWTGSYPVDAQGKFIKPVNIRLLGGNTEFTVNSSAGRKDKEYKPEDYGAEAIIFCRGKISSGSDAGTWVWVAVGTDAWIQKAVQAGILAPDLTT